MHKKGKKTSNLPLRGWVEKTILRHVFQTLHDNSTSRFASLFSQLLLTCGFAADPLPAEFPTLPGGPCKVALSQQNMQYHYRSPSSISFTQ